MMRRLALALLAATGLAAAADLTGVWEMEVQTQAGTGNPTFTFQQDGDKLSGTYRGLLGEAKLAGTVKGDNFEFGFKASYEGQAIEVRYKGSLNGPDSMKGTIDFTGLGEGTFTGKRAQKKGTR